MTSDNKSGILKIFSNYILPIILMVGLLLFAFKDVDLSKAFNLIGNTSFFWLAVFLIVFMFSHFIRALRWKFIIKTVKPDARMSTLYGATLIGYGVNCAVPRLGELYRASFLGKWENISRSSMLGTIVIERIIDLLTLGLSVLISVLVYPGNLINEIPWLEYALPVGFAGIGIIIVILILTVKLKEKFYNIIVKLFGRISKRLANKLAYMFEMLAEGFSSLKGVRNYLVVISLTSLLMIVYGLNSLLGFYVLGMNEIKDVTYSMAWVLMTISAFGIVIPAPGGTGSYHLIAIGVLVGLFGFEEEISAAYAILTHLISLTVFIAGTILSVFIVNRIVVKSGGREINFFTALKNKME